VRDGLNVVFENGFTKITNAELFHLHSCFTLLKINKVANIEYKGNICSDCICVCC